jgi:hypothetical protein
MNATLGSGRLVTSLGVVDYGWKPAPLIETRRGLVELGLLYLLLHEQEQRPGRQGIRAGVELMVVDGRRSARADDRCRGSAVQHLNIVNCGETKTQAKPLQLEQAGPGRRSTADLYLRPTITEYCRPQRHGLRVILCEPRLKHDIKVTLTA